MNKKIIVLALVPFIAAACNDHRRHYKKDEQAIYMRTGDAPYLHNYHHSNVFFPVMYMSGGHYYHGGYDSPTARSYYSSSNAASGRSTMYSSSAYSGKSTFSGGSHSGGISRGGFGHSGGFSSGS